MKNCIFLTGVCLLILFVGGSSLAQDVVPPQAGKEQQRNPQPVCPFISVSCPNDPGVSEPLLFTTTISGGDSSATPTYHWEVSGGVITEGQGTPAIVVKIVGYQTVTATLQIGGFDAACAKTASCSIPIHHPRAPLNRFDSYGALPIDKETARLDLFAAALNHDPGAQAYVLGYGGRRGRAGEAKKAADRAEQYLVDKRGIDERRIVSVDGGFKEQLTVDLWLVPTGVTPPATEPTVDPTEVKVIKSNANKSAKRTIRH